MRPCDCRSVKDTKKMGTQGIKIGQNGIAVIPNSVILTTGPATLKVPMKHFKAFAEWYLEDDADDSPKPHTYERCTHWDVSCCMHGRHLREKHLPYETTKCEDWKVE